MNKATESGQRLQPLPAPGECEMLRYGAKADDRAAIAALRGDLARLGHAATVALEYGADTLAGNKALQDLAENAAACARLHGLIADTRK